eukprot:COSAG06_NODE_62026_length_266_cov_0.616766_1_plen_39_part_10
MCLVMEHAKYVLRIAKVVRSVRPSVSSLVPFLVRAHDHA